MVAGPVRLRGRECHRSDNLVGADHRRPCASRGLTRSVGHYRYVGLGEVVALEEEGGVARLRKGVAEAVAEVERGLVAALAVEAVCPPGDMGLLEVDRAYFCVRLAEEQIEKPDGTGAAP